MLRSISSPPLAGLRTCIGTGEMLVFLLQRFPAPFWTLHGEDLRNKGTDPEDTVEMMLTSTLPLVGQRFRRRLRSVPNFQCYREARGLPRVEPHGVCRRLPLMHETATPSEH